jgi:hypothetical protein
LILLGLVSFVAAAVNFGVFFVLSGSNVVLALNYSAWLSFITGLLHWGLVYGIMVIGWKLCVYLAWAAKKVFRCGAWLVNGLLFIFWDMLFKAIVWDIIINSGLRQTLFPRVRQSIFTYILRRPEEQEQ